MKYLSTFSGIEAATVAWHPLGWEPVGFSEIEPFPCAVLNHHYPNTPNYGDITKFREWSVEPFQLLVGGSPCQSFSVAGLRKGLADERGNLMLEFGRLAQYYRPTWVVWENVPGVLSSNGGRDFAAFLTMLAEFGYGFAYRILDAQHFGVAQRRRRVFVVGYLGDWRPAAAVLFESDSLSGNPPPSREKRKGIASFASAGIGTYSERVGTLRANGGDLGEGSETLITRNHNIPVEGETTGALLARDYEGLGNQDLEKGRQMVLTMNGEDIAPCLIKSMEASVGNTQDSAIIAVNSKKWPQDISPTLNASFGDKLGLENQHIDGGAGMFVPAHAFKVRGGCEGGGKGYLGQDECAFTLSTHQDQHLAQPMAFDWQSGGDSRGLDPKHTAQLQRCQVPAVMTHYAVRRLTPIECERLQGFPDNYTAIPWRGKDASQCPDGPRYKALGNSMAVPVMRWIGERIQAVEELMKEI